MIFSNHHRHSNRGNSLRGFTLIELLVVISILVILTAMVIPRLRVINQDRNIREAARIVGSVFASASQRAVTDGTAGVIIERNENMVDSGGVLYGGTTLYTMRAVPPYTGDSLGSEWTRISDNALRISLPLEQKELEIVAVNDFISVNYSSIRYRITAVTPLPPQIIPATTDLTLTLSRGENAIDVLPPLPGNSSGLDPYVIHRQPRKLESSRVELPAGYLVDLRYSGPLNQNPDPMSTIPDSPRGYFYELVNPSYPAPAVARTTTVIFNGQGGIDRVYFYDPTLPTKNNNFPMDLFGEMDSRIPLTNMNFLVTTYEIEPQLNHGILNNESNLWVTVNNLNGGVNIGYNVPSPVGSLAQRITNARGIAATGQNASQ